MADTIETPTIETTEKPTRSSAIAAAIKVADAANSADVKKDEQTTETKVEKTPPVSEKEVPVKKEAEEDEDQILTRQGKDLMLALKDPTKAPIVIKFLAEQAGYSKSDAPTNKAEVKELKNEILEDLKEGLGEEFNVIAERLAPAIEKILNKQLEKSNADIREKFQEQEAEKLSRQSEVAITKLTTDFFGADEELPDNVHKEMKSFMDRVAPSENSSIKEYVADAFHFAIGKLGLTKVDKKSADKIERNRSDAASRLASARVPASNSLTRENAKSMTRAEAIQAAIAAVEKGE